MVQLLRRDFSSSFIVRPGYSPSKERSRLIKPCNFAILRCSESVCGTRGFPLESLFKRMRAELLYRCP